MKFLLFLIAFILAQFTVAQVPLQKITLNSWGTIYLPKNMEIQSGVYKKFVDDAKKDFITKRERIIFQQEGLNNGLNKETYARVIIRTDKSLDYLPNLNTEKISIDDLELLNKEYKSQVYDLVNNPRFTTTIISWKDLKIRSINGHNCLNYSYIRKVGDNNETFSEFYVFWKGKNQYVINIEYRVNETYKWRNSLIDCVLSLKFI
jgi:hypothetical protein